MRYLLTSRRRGKGLLDARVAPDLWSAQEDAAAMLANHDPILFQIVARRRQNAALTYDGIGKVRIGPVTIEPIRE